MDKTNSETSVITEGVKTEEKKDELTIKDFSQFTVKAPVFVLFSEYLGVVSKVIEWSDEWGNGKLPPEWKQKAIKVEALWIFKKLKEKYSIEDIRGWYDALYDVILSKYDQEIEKLEKDNVKEKFNITLI